MVVCYLETYLFVTPHPNVMDGRNRLEKELLALQEKLCPYTGKPPLPSCK